MQYTLVHITLPSSATVEKRKEKLLHTEEETLIILDRQGEDNSFVLMEQDLA